MEEKQIRPLSGDWQGSERAFGLEVLIGYFWKISVSVEGRTKGDAGRPVNNMHLVLQEEDGAGSGDGKIWINTKDIPKDGLKDVGGEIDGSIGDDSGF